MPTATDELRTKFPRIKDVNGRIKELADNQSKVIELAGPDLDFTKDGISELLSVGDGQSRVEKFRQASAELADLQDLAGEMNEDSKAVDAVKNAEKYLNEPRRHAVHPSGGPYSSAAKQAEWDNIPLLGDAFVESESYKNRNPETGKGQEVSTIGKDAYPGDIVMKTTMTTAVGWAPENLRTGRVVDEQTRPVQVLDIIPTGQTSQAAVVYMEETTFTNNAAERAEDAAAAESAIALTERTSTVRSIATFLPVTREQLDDVPQVRGLVNRRLPFMLRQRLDGQVINGGGTGADLEGILNVTGIQTQARGTDSNLDAIYKAGKLVRVTGRAMPNAVLLHPDNWQTIRLAKTADGIYIYGHPADPGPLRTFGWTVVETDVIAANTGLIGDFANFCELSMRQGISVELSTEHASFFISLKVAVLAHMRAAFVTYRPAAFASITSLN